MLFIYNIIYRYNYYNRLLSKYIRYIKVTKVRIYNKDNTLIRDIIIIILK